MEQNINYNYSFNIISFETFVEYGISVTNPSALHNGMPWHFSYRGFPVTHENDDCYIVINEGESVMFHRGDHLITDSTGRISVCKDPLWSKLSNSIEFNTFIDDWIATINSAVKV